MYARTVMMCVGKCHISPWNWWHALGLNVAGQDAASLFYSTITDHQTVQTIMRAIQDHEFPKCVSVKELPDYLAEHVLPNGNFIFMHNLWETRESLSGGSAILLVGKISVAIAVGALSVPHRSPDTPLLESSTRGPQLAFVENLEINIGVIRRTFDSDALTVKKSVMGYRSRTQVAVLYQHDVANRNFVKTVTKRIQAVHVDKLTGSATLEQRIVDNHWTMFPLTRATSRVDNCIKEVGQGKVLVIVDGDPAALLMPGTILDFFQTMEDDQHNYVEATFVRWLRFISFILALYLPALYIATSDFNPELMPQTLSLQIARSREGVPFNGAIEVMIMQLAIEIVREATLRMPKVMARPLASSVLLCSVRRPLKQDSSVIF